MLISSILQDVYYLLVQVGTKIQKDIFQASFSGLLLFLILFSLNSGISKAQDPYFSQVYSNLLYTNPAFAGIEAKSKLSLTYRNQWPGNTTKFETFFASYDQPVEILHGGIGITAMNDRSGSVLNYVHLALIYSYNLKISNTLYMQAGFRVSANQRNLRVDGLIFPNMISPARGIFRETEEILTNSQKFYMDYSAGFIMYSGEWFGGFAIDHLAKPAISESQRDELKLSRKYGFHFTRNLLLTDRSRREDSWIISPGIQYYNQAKFSYFNFGFILSKFPVFTGIQLHHDLRFDSSFLNFSLGFTNSFLKFSYSYDVLLSNPTVYKASPGTHELNILIDLKVFQKSGMLRTIKLPGN